MCESEKEIPKRYDNNDTSRVIANGTVDAWSTKRMPHLAERKKEIEKKKSNAVAITRGAARDTTI